MWFMRKAHAVQDKIWEKLQKLPAGKQVQVLSFVESLGATPTGRRPRAGVYDYFATLVRRKRLKKLSLSKIAAVNRRMLRSFPGI